MRARRHPDTRPHARAGFRQSGARQPSIQGPAGRIVVHERPISGFGARSPSIQVPTKPIPVHDFGGAGRSHDLPQ